ncbi:MAG: hypothetical protein ACI9T9_002796 [Oleiphilaceae bacterium]|jgi:hypothetical protein
MISNAVLRILKPLIRVLIKHDVSQSEFSELAKQAYVEVAYKYFSIPKRKMTYARVAVLTGLSRKEVVRLSSDANCHGPHPKIAHNRASRVITGWLNDAEFLDENKQPKDLPLKPQVSDSLTKSANFTHLVECYSGDISVGAILDELQRTGVVSRIDQGQVRLECLGYVPQTDALDKFEILSLCSRNLLSSGVHNIDKGDEEEAMFQRQLSHQFPEELVHEFKTFSQKNHWIYCWNLIDGWEVKISSMK